MDMEEAEILTLGVEQRRSENGPYLADPRPSAYKVGVLPSKLTRLADTFSLTGLSSPIYPKVLTRLHEPKQYMACIGMSRQSLIQI
jgi:hypothetical protein